MSTDLPRPFSPAELAELIAMPELVEAERKEVLRQAGVAAGEFVSNGSRLHRTCSNIHTIIAVTAVLSTSR